MYHHMNPSYLSMLHISIRNHLPYTFLIVHLQYISMVVSKLLSHTPMEMLLSSRIQHFCTLLFNFKESTHFQSYLGQHLLPPTPQWGYLMHFYLVVFFYFILYFILGSPNFLINFEIFAYIKVHSLYWSFMDLTNAKCHVYTIMVSYRIVLVP